MKTLEEPAYLTVGTDVSAKYRGAFCEAKIKTAKKLVKAKVTFKPDSSTAEVHDEHIKGSLKVGAVVEVKNQDGIYQEATINKLTDASLYTVVFDDGDEKTLRRSSLCLKGARHFAESETLDRLPLTNPEHFGTPVIGKKGNRGRRSNAIQEEESSSSSSEDDNDPQQNEDLYGKVVGVEGVATGDKKKTLWFPAMVISPDCHEDVIMKKDTVFVRSFKDGKFHLVLRKDIKELDCEMGPKAEASLKPVLNVAWDFQCNGTVPSAWKTEVKDESSSSEENEEEEEKVQEDGGSSEEEEEELEPFPEERENFLQQLYKFMEDRGTPINKRPVLGYRNLNLFKLFRLVHRLGGFDSIESGSIWKQVYQDLGIPVLNSAAGYNVKCAYRKYLYGFEYYCTSTGITFHMDLPFKATEKLSSNTDSSIEGPAARANSVEPKPDSEILLSTKNTVKERKSEESGLFRNKVNIRSPKEEDRINSDKEDNGIDKESHKLKAEEAAPTEDPCTDNLNVDPCKDQKKELLRNDSSQEWEEGEEFECYPPGMKVQVRYGRGRNQKTYEATVKESDLEGGEVLYLVHYCGWNVRYDEWIKADKIVRPANKNVPKIKHRKKIKTKTERERVQIESLNDREDLSPTNSRINRSSKLISGSDVFSKMDEFKDAGGQKSPVKSFKSTSNLNGLQAPESSADYSNHEQDGEGGFNDDCPVGQLSLQRRPSPESIYAALKWESEPSSDGHNASVSMGATEVSFSQHSPETNKQVVTEGKELSTRRRKADGTSERTHKILCKGKTRGSKLSEWLSESSLIKLKDRNIGPREAEMHSSSSSEDEDELLIDSQAKEELLIHHKSKGISSRKYNGLKEKVKGCRSSTFWEIPDKRAKMTSGMDDRTPGCRTKGQKDVWSSIQAQWPKKTLKELFSDSDTEAANSPSPEVVGLCEPDPGPEQKSEKPEEPEQSQEKNQEYPSSGSNSILNTPPTTPEPAEFLHEMHSSSQPPQKSVLTSCSPATCSSVCPLIEECVGGRCESDTSTVEMDVVSCEFHMLPQEEQLESPSKVFDANLSSNSSCSLSLSSSSQKESEQKSKVSSSNQKRHKDSQSGGTSKKHKQSHKNLNLHPKKNHKTANSSDSEDQCLNESVAKSLMSKSSTQDMKNITPPKGSARTPPPNKYHKNGDSEHLHHKEQHGSMQGSHTYKWSFQMSDLEKMSSLEKITFLQKKLQDIRNHYLSLKSEVASIDRRRKRIKKKERESAAAALYSSSSSPSSSSLTAAVMLTLAEPTVSGSSQNSGFSLECR
ncbi:AT-rich interactive domain-containing protein 4B isoform X1 [Tachysurus fulvidraco]|uniref:AT-rich interactive domain-containing protein 4B isoform X1 n=1 Tax=Tachysurus fulvidraco TaxID=1234273 RepID=UPI000F4DB80D|nr:AT-rich interactive domain-containing protein 4B isoform X1 [Tachysurus fulvidraco]XP_027021587.1 AT-rich interactive domain-containing protein 4B isoform X1 [Tachysurus fulvidraco]XP_047668625.1 AT-rich interactive domain-containing protein 4B isoform X1 [Tachysurus fulvidraco]